MTLQKKIFLAMVMMLMAFTAIHAQRLAKPTETHRGTIEQQMANAPINENQKKVDALLKRAFSFRGTPYVYGASRPGAFDCSGLPSSVFRRLGGLRRTRAWQSHWACGHRDRSRQCRRHLQIYSRGEPWCSRKPLHRKLLLGALYGCLPSD